MVKRRCEGCRYVFAAPADSEAPRCPDCGTLGRWGRRRTVITGADADQVRFHRGTRRQQSVISHWMEKEVDNARDLRWSVVNRRAKANTRNQAEPLSQTATPKSSTKLSHDGNSQLRSGQSGPQDDNTAAKNSCGNPC